MSNAANSLWAVLGDLFFDPDSDDDGGLPEVSIEGIAGDRLNDVFERLRSSGGSIPAFQAIWLEDEDREVPAHEVAEPARLVQDGKCRSFHLTVRGASWNGVDLPELGMFVMADEIAVDYSMGPRWTRERVAALVDLLGAAAKASPGARVTLWDRYLPEVRERGDAAIASYLASGE